MHNLILERFTLHVFKMNKVTLFSYSAVIQSEAQYIYNENPTNYHIGINVT